MRWLRLTSLIFANIAFIWENINFHPLPPMAAMSGKIDSRFYRWYRNTE
jgi:hypothetical protein